MLKKIILFVLLIIIAFMITSCTGYVSLTMEKGEITNSKGEYLEYYLGKKSEEELSNKLLVMIQGSGRESITKRFGIIEGWALYPRLLSSIKKQNIKTLWLIADEDILEKTNNG